MSRVMFAISHSEHAGAQVIWADLASAFHRRGHKVSLLALYPGRTASPPLQDGLTWNYCLNEAPRSKSDALRAVGKAVGWLNTLAPEVVFTALPASNVILPLAGLISKFPSKIYISHHSPVSTYDKLYDQLDGLIGTTYAVDGIICVSRAVQSSLAKKTRAYRAKSTVIRNALPQSIQTLTSALQRQRQINYSPGRTVVACGRLAEQKNYPVLIRAMAHVHDVTLEIVGAGPDEMALKTLAEASGVAGFINFMGIKSREETLALIATRDVFVQPSLFEGHSLALIEAAEIGIPMIVSDVQSQVEAATRHDGKVCALIHAPHDYLALAKAITSLLDESALRREYQTLSQSLGHEINFVDMVDRYEALL